MPSRRSLLCFHSIWQPTSVFLPGESQGRGSLVGCRLRGRTESDTTEATQRQQQQQVKIMDAYGNWSLGLSLTECEYHNNTQQ